MKNNIILQTLSVYLLQSVGLTHASKDGNGGDLPAIRTRKRTLHNVFHHSKAKSPKTPKAKSTKCKTKKAGKKSGKKVKKGKYDHRSDSDCDPTPAPTLTPTPTPTSPPVSTTSPTQPLTTKPTKAPTESPTVDPTASQMPTLNPSTSPTIYDCSSQLVREQDIDTILGPIVGSSPTSAALSAMDWIVNTDIVLSNTCLDNGSTIIERYTLALIYYSMGGDNWFDSQGWLTTEDHCTSWSGITCTDGDNGNGTLGSRRIEETSESKVVEEINLNGNGVTGQIPAEINLLEKLCALKLYNNDIEGLIPSSLYKLPKLMFLDVEDNNLTGDLFDPSLFNATTLERLRVSNNKFLESTMPTDIGILNKLTQLWIADAGLVGSLPSEITDLVSLQDFIAYDNTLTGQIPTDIGNLGNLKRLDVSNNTLTGTLPSGIGNLLNLETLIFSGNRMTGSIPSEFGNLVYASDIQLADNLFDGMLPSDFAFLVSLEDLDLQGNNFTGRIPDDSAWEALRYINLSGNRFTGSVSTSLFSKEALEVIYLSNNTLSGTIPSNYGGASALRVLWLDGNELTGSVPDVGIGDLPNITEVLLGNNRLSGDIPPGLCGIRSAFSTNESAFEFLHADCYPPEGNDEPNNPCAEGCCTDCSIGKT